MKCSQVSNSDLEPQASVSEEVDLRVLHVHPYPGSLLLSPQEPLPFWRSISLRPCLQSPVSHYVFVCMQEYYVPSFAYGHIISYLVERQSDRKKGEKVTRRGFPSAGSLPK